MLLPVDLAIDEARVTVIGANGSGKSTLQRLLNGLVHPTRGRSRAERRAAAVEILGRFGLAALATLPQTLVLATHDLDVALDADRTLVVDAARVVFDGHPSEAVEYYRRLVDTP